MDLDEWEENAFTMYQFGGAEDSDPEEEVEYDTWQEILEQWAQGESDSESESDEEPQQLSKTMIQRAR